MINILRYKMLIVVRGSAPLIFFMGLTPALVFTSAFAEMRQHGSHVHGEGKLNIGLAGKEVHIELESPAANIVGFEHAPGNSEQKRAVHEAEERLEDAESLFIHTKKAGCRKVEARVKHDMLQKEHKEHEHHGKHESDHDDHKHHNDGKHEEHEEDHHDHGNHSEFHAHYRFECTHPEKLKEINVMLFSSFPGFEKLDVQLLTPKGQTAVELTPKKHKLSL